LGEAGATADPWHYSWRINAADECPVTDSVDINVRFPSQETQHLEELQSLRVPTSAGSGPDLNFRDLELSPAQSGTINPCGPARVITI